ncbi:MAG: DUF2313 domain-containing protein [Deferribacteraceae bacterium]|jgi:uncharacterized protein YmfQ (DUF2313 family)|nr:DUF2313 domain-containing protein [Deferribacteraceae bacterium]
MSYRHERPLIDLVPLPLGDNAKRLLAVYAKYLDVSEDYLLTALEEFFPLSALETISRWEDELGIKVIADNLMDRRLNAYVRHKGETLATMDDILAVAVAAGLEIEIIKHQVFRAGIDAAGDAVWDEEWAMRMDVLVITAIDPARIEAFRARVVEFLPAFITGYVIYNDVMLAWR